MLKHYLLPAAFLLAAPTAGAAVSVNWVDWQNISTVGGGVTVTGTLDVNGSSVGVTYHNDNGISFANVNGIGTDFWQNSGGGRNDAVSPYTSVGPTGNTNSPTGPDIIGMDMAGSQTLTFSQPVTGLYYSYVSMNGNTYDFDQAFALLSNSGDNIDGNGVDACGYWGCGTVGFNIFPNGNFLFANSGEPHGTIRFGGTFSALNWTSAVNENWNGFTVGVAATTATVPLPATGLMLLGGLVPLALRRRRG